MTVIGFGHKSRVGKDTAAQWLVDHHGFHRLSFADEVRSFALAVDPIATDLPPLWHLHALVSRAGGWEAAKRDHPEVRRLLDRVGVAARQWFGDDIWLRRIAAKLAANPTSRWVVTDVRFPNEVDLIRSHGGWVVRIDRDGCGVANTTDCALDAFDGWDRIIGNDGSVAALHSRVSEVLADYMKEHR